MGIKILEKKRKKAERKRKKAALKNGAKGLAIGSIAGAVGAALFTPKSGKETREAIVQGADIKNRKEQMKEKGKKLKCCSGDFLEKRKEKIETSKETIKEYLKNKKRKDIDEDEIVELLEENGEDFLNEEVETEVKDTENIEDAEKLVEEE